MSNLRKRLGEVDKESSLELSDSFVGENVEGELKSKLTHTITIEPTSIEGYVSDFNIDLEIKMSNGDKITYIYMWLMELAGQ